MKAILLVKKKEFDQVIEIISQIEEEQLELDFDKDPPVYNEIFESEFIANSEDFFKIKNTVKDLRLKSSNLC